jgi:hypothetical protein
LYASETNASTPLASSGNQPHACVASRRSTPARARGRHDRFEVGDRLGGRLHRADHDDVDVVADAEGELRERDGLDPHAPVGVDEPGKQQ